MVGGKSLVGGTVVGLGRVPCLLYLVGCSVVACSLVACSDPSIEPVGSTAPEASTVEGDTSNPDPPDGGDEPNGTSGVAGQSSGAGGESGAPGNQGTGGRRATGGTPDGTEPAGTGASPENPPDAPSNPNSCGGNLLDGDLGVASDYIGGDPERTDDNPCGLQGSIHAYGDDISCIAPEQPCTPGRCCIRGTSIVDDTFVAWGCGLGVELNSHPNGALEGYDAALIEGFRYTLTGSLTQGQYVRVHLVQPESAEVTCPPFQGGSDWHGSPVDALALAEGTFTHTVRFDEVECPPGAETDCDCTPPGPNPTVLQFQVTGGEVEGPFELCLEELTPLVVGQTPDPPLQEEDDVVIARVAALTPDVINGAELFASNCAPCHGNIGQGIQNLGPAYVVALADNTLEDTIRAVYFGVRGTLMVGFGGVPNIGFTDREIRDVVEYITTEFGP